MDMLRFIYILYKMRLSLRCIVIVSIKCVLPSFLYMGIHNVLQSSKDLLYMQSLWKSFMTADNHHVCKVQTDSCGKGQLEGCMEIIIFVLLTIKCESCHSIPVKFDAFL